MIDQYRAGACNIGETEITARRRFGHAATIVTVGLFLVLLAIDAPPALRLLLFFPAAGAAAGYLQAALHFCADYGWRGVFNLGTQLRSTTSVEDRAARAADRRRALQIVGASAAVGLLVAFLALLV